MEIKYCCVEQKPPTCTLPRAQIEIYFYLHPRKLTRQLTQKTVCLSIELHFLQNKNKSICVIHIASVNVTYWPMCTYVYVTDRSIHPSRKNTANVFINRLVKEVIQLTLKNAIPRITLLFFQKNLQAVSVSLPNVLQRVMKVE
jgi:hypothetical protein